ncbi:hypothetical protein MGSAQ_003365 [marine sediment metagenome]|uniref:Uncharacterized protein n=1 Tax=marine sediment metagenome TaxID=412755 RepID=A0A1B6NP40_9ZZZZ
MYESAVASYLLLAICYQYCATNNSDIHVMKSGSVARRTVQSIRASLP